MKRSPICMNWFDIWLYWITRWGNLATIGDEKKRAAWLITFSVEWWFTVHTCWVFNEIIRFLGTSRDKICILHQLFRRENAFWSIFVPCVVVCNSRYKGTDCNRFKVLQEPVYCCCFFLEIIPGILNWTLFIFLRVG